MKKWINTKDKLPRDGKRVLTIDKHSVIEVLYISEAYGEYGKKYWFDRDTNNVEIDTITHYQELPKAPVTFKMKTINGVPNKKSMKILFEMYGNLLEESDTLPLPAFSWSYANKKSVGRFLWICKDTQKNIEGLKLFLRSYGVIIGKYDLATNGFKGTLEIKGYKPVS